MLPTHFTFKMKMFSPTTGQYFGGVDSNKWLFRMLKKNKGKLPWQMDETEIIKRWKLVAVDNEINEE